MKFTVFKHKSGKYLATYDCDEETILTLTEEIEPDGLFPEGYTPAQLKATLEEGENEQYDKESILAMKPAPILLVEDFTPVQATINLI